MSLNNENIVKSEPPSAVSQPQSSDAESTSSTAQSLPLISDFEIVKHVSSGAFGDVFLAKRSGHDDRQLFAVKRVSKKTLITKNLMDQIRCERAALAISRCRYVVHLYYSLQTDSHVYLVMEYLCGGDLRSMLLAVGCLSQEAAVVYTAEVAIALEYLHSHGIIHRDIKPDNMLVSASGHIKLTDFGLSQVNVKRLTQQQLMHGNCTPGGYQASAEKRYPRTPRQLMSLATDFSFGSASEAAAPLSAGGGSCPRSRRRRQYCQRTARFLTPADEEATTAYSTIPSPLPAPCFDESPLPQDTGDASKQAPPLFPSNEEKVDVATVVKELLEAVDEEITADDCEVVKPAPEPSTDHAAARVRFKSGASAAAAAAATTAEGLLSSDEFCDPLLLSDGQSAQHPQLHHQRLLGTPDYLAPELIQGLPHGTAVDYWALGVCLFEFLNGYPPFTANSPELVMENILNRQIPWPDAGSCLDAEDAEPELSSEAISAIDGLLSSDPDNRLSIDDLRRHPLFTDVAWQRLHSSEAPFVPDLGGDCQDTSYFEPANRVRASSRRLD